MIQQACDFGPCANEPVIHLLRNAFMFGGIPLVALTGFKAIRRATEKRGREAVHEALYLALALLMATNKLWASDRALAVVMALLFLSVTLPVCLQAIRFAFSRVAHSRTRS